MRDCPIAEGWGLVDHGLNRAGEQPWTVGADLTGLSYTVLRGTPNPGQIWLVETVKRSSLRRWPIVSITGRPRPTGTAAFSCTQFKHRFAIRVLPRLVLPFVLFLDVQRLGVQCVFQALASGVNPLLDNRFSVGRDIRVPTQLLYQAANWLGRLPEMKSQPAAEERYTMQTDEPIVSTATHYETKSTATQGAHWFLNDDPVVLALPRADGVTERSANARGTPLRSLLTTVEMSYLSAISPIPIDMGLAYPLGYRTLLQKEKQRNRDA